MANNKRGLIVGLMWAAAIPTGVVLAMLFNFLIDIDKPITTLLTIALICGWAGFVFGRNQ